MTVELAASTATPLRKAPPHSLDAEKCCLGSVLIKPAALLDLDDLHVDDFFLPAHREIFDAMRALSRRGAPIDAVTVADELQARGMLARLEGGAGYLVTVMNFPPTAENVAYHAKVVAERAALRRLVAACGEIMSSANGGDIGDVEGFLDDARAKLGAIEIRGGEDPVSIGAELPKVIDEIEARGQRPEEFRVMTGLRIFDDRMCGLCESELVVIAANPSGGKTALMWNWAVHAARTGVPTLVFSLEQSRGQLIERALAGEAGVNGHHIRLGRLSQDEWYRVNIAAERLSPLPLEIYDLPATVTRIKGKAKRWWARQQRRDGKKRQGLIAVDYLGMIESEHEDEMALARELGLMCKGLKNLAKLLKLPVILLCQLSRDNVKGGKDGKPRPPVLQDLRDSGAIEAAADVVIFPYRTPVAEGVEPLPSRGEMFDLLVRKNRNGPLGDLPVEWHAETMTFSDTWADPEPPQIGTLL